MKATISLLMLTCSVVWGQSQTQSQNQSRRWLRVGLNVNVRLRAAAESQVQDSLVTELRFGAVQTETANRIQNLFTRQLRKLGDVQVVPFTEADDVKLKVLVSASLEPQQNSQRLSRMQSYAVAVIATRPVIKEEFAGAWLEVTAEKNLETTCANLITRFDNEVLEADRKRIRFPDTSRAPNNTVLPEPPPVNKNVTLQPEPFHDVKPELVGGSNGGAGSRKGGGLGPGEDAGLGGVYKVGDGVTAPSLLHTVEPEYSEEARNANYQGTVILYVEVSPDGHAVNPRVVRSLGLGLDEKAIEAVRKWEFRPGYKDGKAVTVAVTIEVNFRLLGKK